MITTKADRRSARFINTKGEQFDESVVREGMRVQLEVNTVSAIEYLKNRGVGSATIQRALSSFQLRNDDKLAITAKTTQQ